MKKTWAFKVVAAASILAIAACDREAGLAVDASAFGASTENNYLVQSGQRSYAVSLAKRFAEEVPSTINFAFDSYQLDQNARAALKVQADWIKQFPEVTFKVYGHTDLVGSASYNKALGLRRAQAAVNYLISQGISRERLAAVVSYGKTQPLIVTQGRERQNRRTVTEVSGFLKRHPTVLNGKYAEVVFREYVASAVPATELTGLDSSVSGGSE